MRKAIVVSAAVLAAAIIVPLGLYAFHGPSKDPLGDKLRGFGFLPVEPASTLVGVGSLYYVSADLRRFTAICNADKTDVGGYMNESPSPQIEQSLKQNGSFVANMNVALQTTIKAGVDKGFSQTVHFSLTDVLIDEITLGDNGLIYTKLMSKPECNQIATQLLNSDGYVCQGQQILRARAEIETNRSVNEKVAGDAAATFGGTGDGAKSQGETKTDSSLVEHQGLPSADAVLTYGVVMTPTCLAPKTARFVRTLPTTAFGQTVNYVLYHIVEPLLPTPRDEVDVAANASAQAK
ncbi:MAG: hypothetical protein JO136_17155 [Hyphomicrobiales bacterium]|jgi:hypothetical protein|nr:hypothetical protein [Hyphomicrobiales bacterium]MBV9909885.1 hypothetical protein [Hyphomicrobiales bacterium]